MYHQDIHLGHGKDTGFPVSSTYQGSVERLFAEAGVRINGRQPWDIQIHNPAFFHRILAHGTLGFGESYMEGWWDAEDLDGLVYRLLQACLDTRIHTWDVLLNALRARLFNLQGVRRAFEVGRRHYDLSTELYKRMLGRRLVYSCGYWKEAADLDTAQEAKLELVFRKLGLKPGMRILDIGCGWGEALKMAAERYGVEGVGVTISVEQAAYAKQLCAGLPVDIRVMDYRALEGKFDRILSIGMFEHVGVKNYRRYMQVARDRLKDDGLFLLHCIGGNTSVHETDPWIERYIFPNGMLPSISQIGKTTEGLFIMEDWHNFGVDYDKTLMAWQRNFEQGWDEVK
ncbi:MAG: cyclopropane fatty acyl phospholipid synthase, partial [Candidatus Dormibacteraceae bacterium]